MKLSIKTVVAMSALIATNAFAGGYVEVSPVRVSASEAGIKVKATGVQVAVGYDVNEAVAIEGVLARSGNLTASYGGLSLDVPGSRVTATGAGVRLQHPIGNELTLVGRTGLSRNEVSIDGFGSESATDPYFGLGATYQATKDVGVGVEYRVYKTDNVDVKTIGITTSLRF